LLRKQGISVIPLLLTALGNASVGTILQDSRGGYLYITSLPPYFPVLEPSDATDEGLFGNGWDRQVSETRLAVIGDGETRRVTLTRDSGGAFHTCECCFQRHEFGADDYGVLVTVMDLTAERRREETLKALLREVSHRSKNLLAIVLSIASQTARNSISLDGFIGQFRGRIASLASTQDLVTDSNWRGAYLFDLAHRQFARYLEDSGRSVVFEGVNLDLSPNAATHIGLALHELIVNATSYGAFAAPGGSVRLAGAIVDNGDGSPTAEMVWDERIAPGARPRKPKAEGQFGSTVLQRIVPSSIGGEATYLAETGNVSYVLRFPMPEA